MTTDEGGRRFLEGKEFLDDLMERLPELYLQNVNVDGHKGRLYEIDSRYPGKVVLYLLGEIANVEIRGTTFADPKKRALWDAYHEHRSLTREEFESAGGMQGFDPIPLGDYVGQMGGFYRGRLDGAPEEHALGLALSSARGYQLDRDELTGDVYEIKVFLNEFPSGEKELILLNP